LIKFQVPVGRNFSIISTTFFNQNWNWILVT
jgi:hypothetical protein